MLLAGLGQIRDLELQPRWRFTVNGQELRYNNRPLRYTADFAYTQPDGQRIVEDVKGTMTRDVPLRLALMVACHGIAVRLIGKARPIRG